MCIEYKVEIHMEAHLDLSEIHSYYYMRTLNIGIADNVVDKLYSVIYGLAFMPRTRPMITDDYFHDENYRKAICGEYIIPFVIDDKTKTVWVTRIFHGKTNFQQYL